MEKLEEDRIFADREEAGVELGKLLKPAYRDKNVLVLGIPRGGVVIAYELAKALHGELAAVITKKLPHPEHNELAIGSVAEDGSVYLTALAHRMDHTLIQKIVESQKNEIQSRVRRFRNGKSLPDMKNRIVIIADDGIATGSTIVPAIKLCKKQGATSVIVAAPVSGENYVDEINELADNIVVAEQPEFFYAVSQVYEDFHHLSDEEVVDLLKEFEPLEQKDSGSK